MRSIKQRLDRFSKKSSIWLSIQIIIFAVMSILLLPIIIVFLPTIVHLADRQKRKSADRFPCSNCGNILGESGMELANIEWSEFVNRLQQDNPGIRFRMNRTIDAICVNCGSRFTYLETLGTFQDCS
jgi:hypothetical protein